VNRRSRDDAELRSAAGDRRPGRRIARVYGDFRRSQPGPGLVRMLVLIWSGCSSLTGKSLEAFLTYDNMPGWLPTLPGLTAVEHSSHAAPAVAGAVLMMVNPGPGMRTLVCSRLQMLHPQSCPVQGSTAGERVKGSFSTGTGFHPDSSSLYRLVVL
jgi:hypothetical protein